ncbi:MAG: hypothetical protein R3249_05070 [Nitriliruptorales bacterium]|nr:hypothetical protein [Nitriliruptorales bacterium]
MPESDDEGFVLPPLRDDGLPTAPDGTPLLQRWFLLILIPLVLAGLVVIGFALASAFRPVDFSPAERRPRGGPAETHDSAGRLTGESEASEAAVGCVDGAFIEGDEGARSAGRRALSAVCQLVQSGDFPLAEQGVRTWVGAGQHVAVLRFVVFQRTGLDSTVVLEADRIVIEVSNKFIFDDATEAAPTLVHEFAHLGQAWPTEPLTAADELAAMLEQQRACDRIAIRQDPPRTCLDSAELFELEDPLEALVEAGWPA